jgi:hypothetical protein
MAFGLTLKNGNDSGKVFLSPPAGYAHLNVIGYKKYFFGI